MSESRSRLCLKKGNNKIANSDEAPVNKTIKLDVENASPKRSCNAVVSGHSTPIRKENRASNMEDSPELDYRYSPISMPCTQENGNEVAWEWHTPVKKGSQDKLKLGNNLRSPKRTQLVQKKRNSNSPLLHKPLRKKQVKMADTEDIGKFTAELMALNEKIGSIQQNNNNDCNNAFDIKDALNSKLLIESDNDSNNDIMAEGVPDDKVEEKKEIDSVNNITNNNFENHPNYLDLFDDSLEDSMVKCSQEVEEKFNLHQNIKPDAMVLPKISEEKEASVSENGCRYLMPFDSFTESSQSSASRIFSSNTSSDLKTYSNTSYKSGFANSVSNTSASNSKRSNNVTANILATKQTSVDSESVITSDNFPDDSFDDCLATCMIKEESNLFSRLTEYDFCSSDCNTNHSSLSKEYSPPSSNKNNILSNHPVTNKVPPSESSALANRRFFKTKSLSDQCFNQSKKNINVPTTTVKSEKRSIAKPSVSTTYPSASTKNPYKNNNFPATNETKTAHTSNILKEDRLSGHCIIKYKSTSSLLNTKEMKDSNFTRCTPEEIERKRLEAKMKLEAKRKSQQMRVTNNPSGRTVKR